MTSVSAADLTKHFGRWRERAPGEPVSVTRHAREAPALQSADGSRRLPGDCRRRAAREIPDDLFDGPEGEAPAFAADVVHLVPPRPPWA